MRRRLVIGVLAAFAAWFLVKAVPYLTEGRPAVWATPTSEPYTAAQLSPVTVPARRQVCVDGMPWAPDARYVQLRVLPGVRPARAPELGVEATGPGYRATGTVPAGLRQNDQAIARIAPAPRELSGRLCVTNRGARALALYGVGRQGRLAAPVEMTVAGREVADRQLSVTLLSNPDQSLIGRMGDVLDHVAAFRPIGTWIVWLVLAALLVGVPAGVAVALGKAAALDDDQPSARS
jgi:hypothetical protein